MKTSLRVRNGDLQSSSQPCSVTVHRSAHTMANTQLRRSSSISQRSSSDAQLTIEADMRVQMIFFGQSYECQTVIPGLGWMPIELPIPESTRSSANSSQIKSYDCLKLTLLFQPRNDFMDFIQDQKRICDRIFKMAQTHAQYQLKRVNRNQNRCMRSPKPGAHSSDAGISGARSTRRTHLRRMRPSVGTRLCMRLSQCARPHAHPGTRVCLRMRPCARLVGENES